MADQHTLPPSREVFEAEILATARQPDAEEKLAEMLVRYFCDDWMIHNESDGRYCLHINGNPSEGYQGTGFAHVLTVALLAEYDEQIGGEGDWERSPR